MPLLWLLLLLRVHTSCSCRRSTCPSVLLPGSPAVRRCRCRHGRDIVDGVQLRQPSAGPLSAYFIGGTAAVGVVRRSMAQLHGPLSRRAVVSPLACPSVDERPLPPRLCTAALYSTGIESEAATVAAARGGSAVTAALGWSERWMPCRCHRRCTRLLATHHLASATKQQTSRRGR